jgi:exodeoxyribonuclease VII small subunit
MNDSPEISEISVNANLKGAEASPSNVLLPPNWNYETTVSEIETIINRIELGELELSDVFDQFSTAVEQLRQCEAFLMRQQQQVDLLIETLLDEPEGS